MKPIIVLDTYCDLPLSYHNLPDVYMVQSTYSLDGVEFWNDGDTSKCAGFYQDLRAGKMATTTQVPVQELIDLFNKLLPENRPIIYLAFSSALSGTYQSGVLAAQTVTEEHPEADITILDSRAASLGLGLLAKYLIEKRDAGASKEELIDFVENNKLRLNHWFTVDDLKFLQRGGRISGVSAFVGTMLNIKPVLWVDEGGFLKAVQKERGRLKSIQCLFEKMQQRIEEPAGQTIMISHGDCLDDANILKKIILEKMPQVKEVIINYVGPGIGAHSGPGTIALFFLGKARTEL